MNLTSSCTFERFNTIKHSDENKSLRIVLNEKGLLTEGSTTNRIKNYFFKMLSDCQYKKEEAQFHSQANKLQIFFHKIASRVFSPIIDSWQKKNQETFDAFSEYLQNRYKKDGLDNAANTILEESHEKPHNPLTTKQAHSIINKCERMRSEYKSKSKILLNVLNKGGADLDISKEVKNLLANEPIPQALVNALGNTNNIADIPIMQAIKNDLPWTIATLVEEGAHMEGGYFEQSKSPIQYAIENKHLHLIELLRRFGADINQQNEHGESPLQYAVNNKGNNKAIKALLDAGAESEQVLISLLNKTENPKEIKQKKEIVNAILDTLCFRISLNRPVTNNLSVTDIVIENKDYPIMELLVEKAERSIGENLITELQDGTPQVIGLPIITKETVIGDQSPMLYKLMDHLLSIDQRTEQQNRLIDRITSMKSFKSIDKGFTYSVQNNLHTVLKSRLEEMKQQNEKIPEQLNDTLLSHAIIKSPNLETVKLLIDNGAELNPTNIEINHLELAILMLAYRIKIKGNTNEIFNIIKLLINKGANINKVTRNGALLHQALKWRLKSVVDILLANDADVLKEVNIDDKGNTSTVLKFATQCGMSKDTINIIKEKYNKQKSKQKEDKLKPLKNSEMDINDKGNISSTFLNFTPNYGTSDNKQKSEHEEMELTNLGNYI